MKIGILTFHRACNYGAVLQCYALQQVLKRMGYEVKVIDYAQRAIDKDYYIINWRSLFRAIYHLRIYSAIRIIKNVPIAIRKQLTFKRFVRKYLDKTTECTNKNVPSNFDAYIIGSDQLWNTDLTSGIDPIYIGKFNRSQTSKLLTYAVSTNLKAIEGVATNIWETYLKEFDTISVREPNVAELLYKKTKLDIRVDLDPTLITDAELWQPLINNRYKGRRYVLLYEIWARTKFQGKSLYSHAKRLADSLNIELIDISDYKSSVNDFISAFKYAEVVITSSFHGTAFSLIFKRPFYVYTMNDSMDRRYVDLMCYLQASDLVKDLDFYPIDKPAVDFDKISELLNKKANESLLYLSHI